MGNEENPEPGTPEYFRWVCSFWYCMELVKCLGSGDNTRCMNDAWDEYQKCKRETQE